MKQNILSQKEFKCVISLQQTRRENGTTTVGKKQKGRSLISIEMVSYYLIFVYCNVYQCIYINLPDTDANMINVSSGQGAIVTIGTSENEKKNTAKVLFFRNLFSTFTFIGTLEHKELKPEYV